MQDGKNTQKNSDNMQENRNRGFAGDAKAITKKGALSHTPNNSDENGPGSRLSDAGRLNVISYQLNSSGSN
jgi:hypothetical protein